MSGEDICVWSDGTSCLGSELEQMTHMSDDYVRLLVDTDAWINFLDGVEP